VNDTIKNAIKTLREAFRNDGAEGESVHLVCDELERRVAKFHTPSKREAEIRAWLATGKPEQQAHDKRVGIEQELRAIARRLAEHA
jgi:urease accessory protein UreE